MSFDLYQEAILDELRHPQNKGELPDADVTIHETNASCGDDLTIFVKFDEAREKIADLKWHGQGCAISQAAMSFLSEKIKGMSVTEIMAIQQADIEAMLGLQEPIAYGRIKCLLLGLNTVQKAIKAENDRRTNTSRNIN